jgi:phage/conjugal plasmid C-4 type zinc finger TraR family protein
MDDLDRASEINGRVEAMQLAARIEAAAQAGPGLSACEECGAPIPAARRRAVSGCTRCVGCQENFERHFSRR